MRSACALAAAVVSFSCAPGVHLAHAGSSFATAVIEFDQGRNPAEGYGDPTAALGEPTRDTGDGIFPAVVSPFNAPWIPDEIFSLGSGGFITLGFDTPITNNPRNPFGVDFLIFDNAQLFDGEFPAGICIDIFGNEPYVVEVSADGEHWEVVRPATSNGLFPTCGYLDSGQYDEFPGRIPADFTKPVDPAITMRDLFMLTYPEILAIYNGSGGGAGYDLAATSLNSVNFVRISNPAAPGGPTIEIDAVSIVTPVGSPADFVDSDTFAPPGDGIVDAADLAFLLGQWGRNPGSPADMVSSATFEPPGDGVVDAADLAFLLGEWTN